MEVLGCLGAVGLSRISRPGAPGRGDMGQHVTSFFWMRCGCARECQHGVRRDDDEVRVEDGLNVAPVLLSTPNQTIVAEWWVLGGAPARCSESDGRMIYGVSEAITEMVLRHLENQGSSPRGTFEANKTCVVEPDRGKWVVKSAFGIVKHGGLGLRSMVV
ncbi:unnamed protein product [Prunus armeniaca]